MAWRCSGSTNEELIQRLAQAHLIATPTVRDAMLAVDRKHYSKFRPYEDAPQTIGYGATISAPHMHAAALEALLSCLDKGAKVDHIPELVEKAKENVRADNAALLDSGRVRFEVADGRGGFPGEAPYDCIHVGAAAENMPKELINQLKAPGRMFIPVGPKGMQAIFVVDKDEHGKVTMVKSMDVMYVPLTDAQKQHPSGLQHGEL
ncbi:hypothetical protein DFQ27_008118 [Actinomortierella ambigua]|uniref:protein-L-isoaspartate(D-aspartate) O-methyltransferase n=1 Tax=Actinomortierella ambigua TaxID=1343610 RepID=A0A9P6QKH6_9FUNG|nr:hypothetical protein DFQ27_008118 [Actinomortierella ambigua]